MAQGHYRTPFKKALLQFITEPDSFLAMLKWVMTEMMRIEAEGKVGYRHGEKNAELERMDDLKLAFVAEMPLPEAVLQELLWDADFPAGFFPDPPVEYFS